MASLADVAEYDLHRIGWQSAPDGVRRIKAPPMIDFIFVRKAD